MRCEIVCTSSGCELASLPDRLGHILLATDTGKTLLYNLCRDHRDRDRVAADRHPDSSAAFANQYTPALLRHFRDDDELEAYRHYLLLPFGVVLLCCLFPAYKWIQLRTTIMVAASFIVLVLAVRRITTMLNPVEYLLPKAKEEAKLALQAAFNLRNKEADAHRGGGT